MLLVLGIFLIAIFSILFLAAFCYGLSFEYGKEKPATNRQILIACLSPVVVGIGIWMCTI